MKEALPEMIASGSCVAAGDLDNDDDLDLFVGSRVVPGKYPFPPRGYLLRNDEGIFTDITAEVAHDLTRPGMVTSAVWSDYDGDDDKDLIVVGEWMPISIYQNKGGTLEDMTAEAGLTNTTGWWNEIIASDIDEDGDMDYVAGNYGLNSKFKVSEKEPIHIYCHDFDNTGTLDIVLGYYNQGLCYPVRGRECSSEQMPNIKEKFPTYNEFGRATITDVYGETLDKALHYEAKTFASTYIENQGEGKFRLIELPTEAQFSTVFGIVVSDFNGDDEKDLLIAGNFFVPEVETGRADASIGLLMKGNGKGGFTPVKVTESGFFVPRDVRDLAMIKTADGSLLILVANNNDKLQSFKLMKNNNKSIALLDK